MNSGLHRIQLSGPTGLARLSEFYRRLSERLAITSAKIIKPGWFGAPAILLVCLGAWWLASGNNQPIEDNSVRLAAATITEPAPPPIVDQLGEAVPTPAAAAAQPAPLEAAPVNGLRISSQSWRRGGLGSRALVTLTLRNGNDYAIRNIEIFCSFNRRDGSHLTDRRRMIHETVNRKSRKTFTRMHIGFVNVNADKAKCSVVTASRA